jgi:pimeloyl-ACP methyl ester carboxylesterase
MTRAARRCDRVPGSRRRPVDVVFVPFFGNVRWVQEQPLYARFLERLTSFSRLILFDKCGTGLSDRPRWLTVEAQMDDMRAVTDAADSERAALLGAIQGSRLWALFAAESQAGAPPVSPARIPADWDLRRCDLPTTRALTITVLNARSLSTCVADAN